MVTRRHSDEHLRNGGLGVARLAGPSAHGAYLEEGTRRVRLVRGEGRGVSTEYGEGGGGGKQK